MAWITWQALSNPSYARSWTSLSFLELPWLLLLLLVLVLLLLVVPFMAGTNTGSNQAM
jgi:hypothetical protein